MVQAIFDSLHGWKWVLQRVIKDWTDVWNGLSYRFIISTHHPSKASPGAVLSINIMNGLCQKTQKKALLQETEAICCLSSLKGSLKDFSFGKKNQLMIPVCCLQVSEEACFWVGMEEGFDSAHIKGWIYQIHTFWSKDQNTGIFQNFEMQFSNQVNANIRWKCA